MRAHDEHRIRLGALGLGLLLSAVTAVAYGVGTSSQFAMLPPVTSTRVPGLVMLVLSNDHQLTVKAYTDYSDLDGDGVLDTTYRDTVEYYGYFDSRKCYTYGSGYFSPAAAASGANGHHCNGGSGQWSGNFLNWATMTRLDVIRKVLYGGYRSTDTTSQTILERVLIPTDGHAFSKVFQPPTGDSTQNYTPYAESAISLCSVTWVPKSNPDSTYESKDIDTSQRPPLIRVARGVWREWAAGEVYECAWRDEVSGAIRPKQSDHRLTGSTDPIARVEVCRSGLEESNCKSYPDSTASKPVGLLQRYGEDGTLRFGLISGSFEKNTKGGVLRRSIQPITGNTEAARNEIDTRTGQFINQAPSNKGIVNTLNRLRISKARFNTYPAYSDCSSPGITKSEFLGGTSGSKQCRDWGNPLSEMYLEALRYFSGASAGTTDFDPNDANYVYGAAALEDAWTDPMPAQEWCAQCNVVVLSTGLNSFDADDLTSPAPVPGLSGAADISTRTDAVGTLEGISGTYLIGRNGTDNNDQCTAKTLSGLSSARGVCPEVPTMEGSYQIAGLAYHARTTDLRTDRTGTQSIDTYSVALAESLPRFTFPVGSGAVTILPACEANSTADATATSTGWRACSMTDLKVESVTRDASGNVTGGSFLVYWEDSTWGNDYDMDGIARLTVSVSAGEVKVRTAAMQADAGHALRFGYTITGTSSGDGIHLPILRPGGKNFSCLETPGRACTLPDQPTETSITRPTTDTYTQGTSTAKLLENPLWYTAKYGGFTDLDGNGTPVNAASGDNRDWDRLDRDGNPAADGIPDKFFQVTNPAELERRLSQVFANIVNKVSSGTAAAVVANSVSGAGAVYQAVYLPSEKNEAKGQKITWVGNVHALFIDDKSQLREDADADGVLDSCSTDTIVDIVYDEVAKATRVKRYDCDANGDKTTVRELVDLSQLQTVWNARNRLGEVSDVASQRTYGASSATGRYVFTAMDADGDGQLEDSERVDFTTANFGSAAGDQYRLLNVDTPAAAEALVSYLRGADNAGMRSRTIDYGAGDRVWRLGDIVHSTPTVSGEPNATYDTRYNDASYRSFRLHWQGRRQMVYVGANDGMIHAFNGGFYDRAAGAFRTSAVGQTAHPLGGELWAYVPYNLLPHLRWLAELDYPHVYYVDGPPLLFDANIFTPDDTVHIGGWGTVLVVGMRLGGSPLAIDHDGLAGTPETTFRSAYVVLDVTDPEAPPKLLAEVTHPDLGFTTSRPDVVVQRAPGPGNDWASPTVNNWYLVLGSGPTTAASATSTASAKLYAYDLRSRAFVAGLNPLDLGVANAFSGDMRTTDWDNDYRDDAVYFGLAARSGSTDTGRLMRLRLDTLSATTLIDPGQPFLARPLTLRDGEGARWVVGGSGRFLVEGDKSTTAVQSFYGLKEPTDTAGVLTWGTVLKSDLVDTTGVTVYLDGSVSGAGSITTLPELVASVAAHDGWYADLPGDGSAPATRVVNAAINLAPFVFFTDYTPATAVCESEGRSNLHAVYLLTGTAYPYAVLGEDSNDVNPTSGSLASLSAVSLGSGLASQPVEHRGIGLSPGEATIITQGSAADLDVTRVHLPPPAGGRRSWRELTP